MAYHSQKLHVYNLPEEVLGSLAFKGDGATQTVKAEEDVAHTEYIGAQACSGCRVAFTSAEDQKSHARSDLHRYNMKLRLRDQDPVTEEKFEELVENLNESLSGSADSDSDDQSQESTVARLLERNAALSQRLGDEDTAGGAKPSQRSPLIWLGSQHLPENTYWGVYRALLSPQEASQGDEHIVGILRKKQLEPVAMPKMSKDGSPVPSQGPHIFMAMIGGGHFAAMVVSLTPRKGAHKEPLNKQATVLAHKTFHRYTTRRKQGGAQSANDNSKGTAHSAGSGLRRYNEKALIEDVRTLLGEWKSLIDSSELIFVRATGSENRKTLFGPYDGQVLKADDTRLRSFPFTTARATQNELMRCFIKLTRLQTSELKPQEAPKAQPEGAAAKVPAPQTVDDEPSEEEQMALLHTLQIEALVRRAKIPMLLAYFTKNDLSPDFLLQPPAQHYRTPTALHLAAVAKSPLLVQALLVKAGANPGVKNGNDRTAFQLAGDEQTREAFRAARGELGEERWNWDEAQVPVALSAKEMAALKQEREKQREQEELEAQQQRKKAVEELPDMPAQSGGRQEKSILQAYRDGRTPQQVREDEERGMSPELRRKIERERRWRAIEARTRDM